MVRLVPITIPETQWDGEPDEGVVTAWFYADGSHVRAGEVVAEIMVEKVEMEVASPAAGRLRILVAEAGTIRRGTAIAEVVVE